MCYSPSLLCNTEITSAHGVEILVDKPKTNTSFHMRYQKIREKLGYNP